MQMAVTINLSFQTGDHMDRNRRPFKTSFILATLAVALIFSSVRTANAQLGDVGDILQAGQKDAELILSEYLKPFSSGFGAGINSGWVDRAKSHGVLGFHVKLNVTAAMVPDAARSFNVNDLGLEQLTLISGDPMTPTLSGSSSTDTRLGIDKTVGGQTIRLAEFGMPPGTGINFIPTPMVQAGVGIIKDTELMLRFIPPVSLSDFGEIYLYGFGVKHELNQWVPGGFLWPVTLSVMGGYTTFGSNANLNARPAGAFSDPSNINTPATWEDQKISLGTDAYTINLLVGKSLPIISVYGGIGIESSTTTAKVEGNYPYYTTDIEGGQPVRVLNKLTDPVDISIDGENSVRALAGVRISLPLITFNVDYTLAEYSMVSFGFGVSLR